jgi:hypothetical protein
MLLWFHFEYWPWFTGFCSWRNVLRLSRTSMSVSRESPATTSAVNQSKQSCRLGIN